MIRAIAKVKSWLLPRRPEIKAPSLFAIPCVCSHVIEGQRQASAQQVICPKCGEKNFVFPQSAWPPLAVQAGTLVGIPGTRRPLGRRLAAVILGAVVALGAVVWLVLANQDTAREVSEKSGADPIARLEQARVEMGQGKYLTALEHLNGARRSSAYERLPRARKRDLDQCRLEAAILADLTESSLSEILRKANDTPHTEWTKVFARRYRGRALLLDGEVKRDAAGELRLGYRVVARNGEARVRIADLELMQKLGIERAQRVIFGARLAVMSQEPGGVMVIHLEPKSGVLMTDKAALEAASPALRDDPELAAVLKRQKETWKKWP